MSLLKCATRTRLEVALERAGLFRRFGRNVPNQLPRAEFRGIAGTARVVIRNSRFQVGRRANVMTFGMGDALEDVDVVYRSAVWAVIPPSPSLRRDAHERERSRAKLGPCRTRAAGWLQADPRGQSGLRSRIENRRFLKETIDQHRGHFGALAVESAFAEPTARRP